MNRVLLITDDARQASAVQDALSASRHGPFDVTWVTTLIAGCELLAPSGVDAIMVSLSLPDGPGLSSLDRLIGLVPHMPIVTISAAIDEELEAETIRRGGRACLAPADLSTGLVAQLLYDIIRQKSLDHLHQTEMARAGIVLNAIGDAVISTDVLGRIDYMNNAAERLTGWLREDAEGQPIEQVMHIVNGTTRRREDSPIAVVLRSGQAAGLAPDARSRSRIPRARSMTGAGGSSVPCWCSTMSARPGRWPGRWHTWRSTIS